MIEESLVKFIEDSIKKNWDINALADYEGKSLRFSDVGEQIVKLHILFDHLGVKRGDKKVLEAIYTREYFVDVLGIIR